MKKPLFFAFLTLSLATVYFMSTADVHLKADLLSIDSNTSIDTVQAAKVPVKADSNEQEPAADLNEQTALNVKTALDISKESGQIFGNIVDEVAISCVFQMPTAPLYSGELVSIDSPEQVEQRELFLVTAKIKNTGNVPWFSYSSGCKNVDYTFLGTTRNQDRNSKFFASGIYGNTRWFQGNRIKLKTPRVNPGEVAEFTFAMHAPTDGGIYREFFSPVVEKVSWINGAAEFSLDIKVGAPAEDENILKFTKDVKTSINLLDPVFEGDKKILIDLSEQNMYLQLGGVTIRSFPVSTGKRSTPTPVGTTHIHFKQEVRVAHSWPHYIMPKFMQFRAGGYGIHALPSLANDRGVFWREALNHIGTARSHGCVRLLPDDANFTYDFAEVGTTVQVVW